MARKVFFSFHYERDVRRIVQVRNFWVVRPEGEAQPFYEKAEFEEAKRRAGGIEEWIEQQLKRTSVTVILFGAETYDRKWVRHEIKRSYELKKACWQQIFIALKIQKKVLMFRGKIHWTIGSQKITVVRYISPRCTKLTIE